MRQVFHMCSLTNLLNWSLRTIAAPAKSVSTMQPHASCGWVNFCLTSNLLHWWNNKGMQGQIVVMSWHWSSSPCKVHCRHTNSMLCAGESEHSAPHPLWSLARKKECNFFLWLLLLLALLQECRVDFPSLASAHRLPLWQMPHQPPAKMSTKTTNPTTTTSTDWHFPKQCPVHVFSVRSD